ncbi:MAG: sialate O-acetylesterase, partial [Verrucomicrobiaceae bacterium]
LKAVYANGVKNIEIPVTFKEEIPDPVFTLKAPPSWDGRATIEIVPQISNLKEMQAKNVGELKYDWKVSGVAVIKEIKPGKLILKRAQNSGMMTVSASVSNGGDPVTRTAQVVVKEPAKDAWVQRVPDKDEKPVDHQFFARDDKNEVTLVYNGMLASAADSVFLKLYADDKLIKTETQKPAADKSYALSVKLKPGLIKYKVEFGTKTGGAETVQQTVTDMVCGDAYLIDGQSNALATDTGEKAPADTSEWIRSYGGPAGDPNGAPQNLWCNPVWRIEKGEKAQLGWWGMDLAKRLMEHEKMPIFIVNGAVGGTRIDQHQRNEANPGDLNTIYGRMLLRVKQAKLTHGIRGILWHQGENNQGSASPTGDFDWKSYQDYFLEMSAAWKQDFPNIQHYYIFQIWPNSCLMGGGTGGGDMIREKQRTLPRFFSNMDCMSTLGIKPAGPCHFPLAGWSEFARLMQPLIERDNYGKAPTASITAPNLRQASFVGDAKDTIALEFDQPVVWSDALISEFYLDGTNGVVASGSLSGNVVTLKLKAPSTARKITYIKETNWNQDKLIIGANGIAALTFAEVEIGTGR